MDPAASGIIIALISATGGIVVQHFLRSWKEARRGRLDEAQKIADERDAARESHDRERHKRMEWRSLAYRIQLAAIKAGVDVSKLPTMPQDNNTDRP